MPELPETVAAEIKAIREDVSRKFDDKIRALDRKADERWAELKEKPDAVLGESLKAILADAVKAREEKAAAMETALTERMDELETKAKERWVGGRPDPDAELSEKLGGWDFKADTRGRGVIDLPVKAVTTITTANAGGANFYAPGPNIVEYPQDPLVMRSVIAGGTITGSHFKFERELAGSQEGDADYQGASSGGGGGGEGITRPTMDIYTEIVTREVVTIAVTARVSQQVFDDRPAFISWLRNRMGYRVLRFLDREILNGVGNGSNGEIEGINTIATAYDNGHVVAGVEKVQKLDVIRFARNQVELANYMPNYVALHPTDWAGIETLKDGDERYLIGDPRTGGSTGIGRVGAVWGLPVITTAGQTADDFTVGDGMASQLFMREEMTVLASTEDQDNFVKNLVTIRAELRALLANYSALAHVTGDFSDAIAAT